MIFESGKWKPILGNKFLQVDFTVTILILNLSYLGLDHHRSKFFRLFTQPGPHILGRDTELIGRCRPIVTVHNIGCEGLKLATMQTCKKTIFITDYPKNDVQILPAVLRGEYRVVNKHFLVIGN